MSDRPLEEAPARGEPSTPHEERERLRAQVEATPLGLVEWDADYRVTGFSARAEAILGWSAGEVLGRRIDEIPWIPASDWPAVRTVMEDMSRGARPSSGNANRNLRKDGRVVHCEWYSSTRYDADGRMASVLSLVLDVTDREEARAALAESREQLAVASRLAALGTLAAGLAHEINNPLAAEMAGQGLAIDVVRDVRDRLRDGDAADPPALAARLDEVLEMLADAQSAALRIARIVRDFNVLGRPGHRKEPIGVVDVVDQALQRAAPATRRRASVEVVGDPRLQILASPGHLEQALEALLDNAARAIPEGRRGRIGVRLAATPEGSVRVEVSDDGVGISPEVLPRIFDPFFTTREVGQGRGLGLALAYAIVAAHGGTLTVETEPGKGSTFRIELPAARC